MDVGDRGVCKSRHSHASIRPSFGLMEGLLSQSALRSILAHAHPPMSYISQCYVPRQVMHVIADVYMYAVIGL